MNSFHNDYVTRPQGGLQEKRIRIMLDLIQNDCGTVLDIGCGAGTFLRLLQERVPSSQLTGVDAATTTPELLARHSLTGITADVNEPLPFSDNAFDYVICGEVIEHVALVDSFVMEMRRVLKKNGVLILTTPNLAYLPNRLLLLFGIQPLFTETSLQWNLGRRFNFLGQNGPTQGHLKIFTLPALSELLSRRGFTVSDVFGYPIFHNGIISILDSFLAIRPSFAGGFVIKARRMETIVS